LFSLNTAFACRTLYLHLTHTETSVGITTAYIHGGNVTETRQKCEKGTFFLLSDRNITIRDMTFTQPHRCLCLFMFVMLFTSFKKAGGMVSWTLFAWHSLLYCFE